MKQQLFAPVGLLCCAAVCSAIEFAPPVRLKAGAVAIRVEAPGYASPCLADVSLIDVSRLDASPLPSRYRSGRNSALTGFSRM